MKKKILKVGALTENKRIYPKEVLQSAITKANRLGVTHIGVFGTEHPRLEQAALFVKEYSIEGDDLVASFEILKNEKGAALKDLLLAGSVELTPVGHGDVSEAGEVSNYTITSIAIVPTEGM
jgi:hypothetical protein